MQNFEEAFLNMKPVIGDEIYVDMEQNQEQSQTDSGRRSGDSSVTHSQPRISPDYPADDDVDVFEGYSFNDRHSIVIAEEEGVPGKEKPEGAKQDGEFEQEKVLGSNDLTEQTIPITAPVQSPISPIRPRRLPEPPPTHTNADIGPLSNATLLTIPGIPTQVPASPPTLPTGVVENAAAVAFARHHQHDQYQSFKPKPPRQRANVVHARQEKTGVPFRVSEADHRPTDDYNEEDVDDIRGERLDNCPVDLIKVDTVNHNGPGSIKKTVSYHLLSTMYCKLRLMKRQPAIKIFIFDYAELGQSEDCR